jgi:hypothetical protein
LMDIYKAIGTLREELRRLDRAIAALEQRGDDSAKPRRRAWNGAARKAAAERMRKYWEQRKTMSASANGASSQSVRPPSTDIA